MSDAEGIPCAADPRWKAWSRLLLAFMRKVGPVNWIELCEWAKAARCPESRARQLLAHLEITGEASATRPSHGSWVWFATGHLKTKKRKQPPPKLRAKFEAFFVEDDGLDGFL